MVWPERLSSLLNSRLPMLLNHRLLHNIQSYSETKRPALARGVRSQNRDSTLDRCKATSKFES